MDLNHLREFLALVETGSFARASNRLSMSQSVISKHIQALENELGVNLFHRGQKAVTLSEFGEVLYPYAKSILSEQEQYFETINKIQDVRCRSINIGAVGTLRLYGLMEPINRFALEHPDIKIHIQQTEHGLKESLLKGQVDLAFVREPAKLFLSGERIGAFPCVSDAVVAVLPAGHPLAKQGPVNLLHLKEEAFYFLDKQLPLSKLCVNACRSAGFSPNIVGSGFSGPDIIEYVGRGYGIALLGKKLFQKRFGHDSRVAAVEISQYMRTYITLLFPKGSDNHIVNDVFLPFFQEQVSQKNMGDHA